MLHILTADKELHSDRFQFKLSAWSICNGYIYIYCSNNNTFCTHDGGSVPTPLVNKTKLRLLYSPTTLSIKLHNHRFYAILSWRPLNVFNMRSYVKYRVIDINTRDHTEKKLRYLKKKLKWNPPQNALRNFVCLFVCLFCLIFVFCLNIFNSSISGGIIIHDIRNLFCNYCFSDFERTYSTYVAKIGHVDQHPTKQKRYHLNYFEKTC